MTVAEMLQIVGLLETAFSMWNAHGNDDQDLLELREELAGKSREEQVAILRSRSESMRDRANALRDR